MAMNDDDETRIASVAAFLAMGDALAILAAAHPAAFAARLRDARLVLQNQLASKRSDPFRIRVLEKHVALLEMAASSQ
jgi:hypothetical protein